MALVVEDGTGLANANSYASVADADAYHELRGNSVWTEAADSDKEIALVRATDYIDLSSFKGEAEEPGQALQFPRHDLYNRNGEQVGGTVPVEIERACYEYALSSFTASGDLQELTPTPDQSEPRALTLERNKVGTLETEQRFDSSAGIRVKKSYPRADRILSTSGYLLNGGAGSAGSVIR
jgi:hypothetical protein